MNEPYYARNNGPKFRKVMLIERDIDKWKHSVTRNAPLDIANRKEFLISF